MTVQNRWEYSSSHEIYPFVKLKMKANKKFKTGKIGRLRKTNLAKEKNKLQEYRENVLKSQYALNVFFRWWGV